MLIIKKKRTGWMIAMITLIHCSANTQELIMPVGHTEDIFSTHFLRSGQYVLTSAYDNTAKLWDTYSGRILLTFPKLAHSNNHIINSGITTLLSPDKKFMVAITVDGWLKKWSVPNGKLVFQKYILNTLGTHLKFSDDGNHLLVHNRYSNEETEGELINAHTGKTLIKIKKDKGNPFEGRSITLSPKGDSYLATSEKKIRLFSIPGNRLIKEILFDEKIEKADFLPGGEHISVNIQNSMNRLIYNTRLEKVGELPDYGWLSFSDDGKYLLYTSRNKIQLAYVPSGTIFREYELNGRREYTALFSPNGIFIYQLCGDSLSANIRAASRAVQIWRTDEGGSPVRIEAESGDIHTIEFSPDSKYAATISDHVELWDIASGKRIEKLKGNKVSFSMDSRFLSVTNNARVGIYNIRTGSLLQDLSGKANTVTQADFSPDGQQFLTLTNENVIRIWDKNLAKITRSFSAEESFRQAEYAPSGLYILALTHENNAIVYSLENKPPLIFKGITTARFTADSKKVLFVRGNAILLHDLVNHSEEQIHTEENYVSYADISSDEKLIVYIYGQSGMGLIDIAGKTVTRRELQAETIQSVEFNKTSSLIFLHGDHGTAELLDAKTAKTVRILGKRIKVEEGVASVGGYSMRNFWTGHKRSFSEDGRWLIYPPYFSDNVLVVDLTQNKDPDTLYQPGTTLLRGFKAHATDIFLTEGYDDTVRIWKKNKSGFRQISKHAANNLSLSKTANAMVLVNNVELGYFDLQKSRLIFNSIGLSDEDYFSQPPGTNYYTSTKAGAAALTYKIDSHYFSFEQFDHELNRPDKVLEAIGSDTALIRSYRNAHLKRMAKLKIPPARPGKPLSRPTLTVINESDLELLQENREVKFKITCADRSVLDRLHVWVNEVPLFGRLGFDLKKKRRSSLDTTLVIPLSAGRNVVEISVTNIAGTESYRRPYYFSRPEEDGSFYFLGIGIDKFKQEGHELNWSVKDIRDLSAALKQKYGNKILIDTVFDEQVTLENVRALKRKLQATTVNDKVIVAYSGHGLLSKEFDYYLSTYSVDFGNPVKNGLPYEVLEGLLDSIPARQKLMLIDACHSGEVDKEEMEKYEWFEKNKSDSQARSDRKPVPKETGLGMNNSFQLMQELFVDVGRSTGATVISAAAGTQFALEKSDLQNGVFTYSVLEYMRVNPSATVSELRKYVNKRVAELTGGLQVPTTRSSPVSYDWKVW